MHSLDQLIVTTWEGQPRDARQVRTVLAALIEQGVKTNRDKVAKVIAAHKRGVAREIVADEAAKMGAVLQAAATVAVTPEAARAACERTGTVLDEMEALATSICRAAIFSLQGEAGKPTSAGEVATLTTAVTGLGDMLTRAHIARNGMQRLADVTERVSSEGPKDVTPAPPPPTKLASALTMIHGGEGE